MESALGTFISVSELGSKVFVELLATRQCSIRKSQKPMRYVFEEFNSVFLTSKVPAESWNRGKNHAWSPKFSNDVHLGSYSFRNLSIFLRSEPIVRLDGFLPKTFKGVGQGCWKFSASPLRALEWITCLRLPLSIIRGFSCRRLFDAVAFLHITVSSCS